ncbi:MAG: PRC-barrel domain-containing protein [Hyphomonas sp.]
MKLLLATASAAALMLSAAACTAETDRGAGVEMRAQMEPIYDDELTPQEEAAFAADTSGTDAVREEYVLASNELEASDLIGAPVIGASGDEIATVADIWLGENGDTPMLLVRDGGLTGLGGDLRFVSFEEATIAPQAGSDEPEVLVTLAEASLETLPAFEQEQMNDYRLASEMIGSSPTLAFNGETVRIADLILTASGEPRYAIVSPSLVSTDLVVVDMNAVTLAQGDGDGHEVILDIDAETYNTAPAYRES